MLIFLSDAAISFEKYKYWLFKNSLRNSFLRIPFFLRCLIFCISFINQNVIILKLPNQIMFTSLSNAAIRLKNIYIKAFKIACFRKALLSFSVFFCVMFKNQLKFQKSKCQTIPIFIFLLKAAICLKKKYFLKLTLTIFVCLQCSPPRIFKSKY